MIAVNNEICQSNNCALVCPVQKNYFLCVEVISTDHKSFLICAVYIPPKTTSEEYDEFFGFMKDSLQLYKTIIIGDFNITKLQEHYDSEHYTHLVSRFMNFLDLCGSSQYNFVKNYNDKLLDLVIAPIDFFCEVKHHEDPIVPIDTHHSGLLVHTPIGAGNVRNFVSPV
ncbi:hypothetical protein JTB14_029365 [Gonioctena quinquepunctata]|nr:hypothetical protein JTB14_029365 [Gonioctena quinquepunctata]